MEPSNVPAIMNTGLINEASSQWLPSLAVAYALSKSVEAGIARPGEFVISGQTSLGNVIEIIALDYRAHVAMVNKQTFAFEKEEFHLSTNSQSLFDNQAFQTLKNTVPPEGKKIDHGMDILLWIVKANSAAVFFLKSTLNKFARPILEASLDGKSLNGVTISLTTKLVEKNGKKWYDLIVSVPKVPKVIIAPELMEKALSLFRDIPKVMEQPNRGAGSYENAERPR